MLDPAGGADGAETFAGLLAQPDEEASATIDQFQRGFAWLRDPRFVSIAAVQGYAIGAGFQRHCPATSGCSPTTRSCA